MGVSLHTRLECDLCQREATYPTIDDAWVSGWVTVILCRAQTPQPFISKQRQYQWVLCVACWAAAAETMGLPEDLVDSAAIDWGADGGN